MNSFASILLIFSFRLLGQNTKLHIWKNELQQLMHTMCSTTKDLNTLRRAMVLPFANRSLSSSFTQSTVVSTDKSVTLTLWWRKWCLLFVFKTYIDARNSMYPNFLISLIRSNNLVSLNTELRRLSVYICFTYNCISARYFFRPTRSLILLFMLTCQSIWILQKDVCVFFFWRNVRRSIHSCTQKLFNHVPIYF